MFKKILVPLDGTDEAALAVPVAAQLARRFGSSVLLLELVSTSGAALALATDVASGAMTDPATITGDVDVREAIAEGYVSAMAAALVEQGISASFAVGRGDESAGILAAAEREGVELIVMATHGRGALGRLVFGSVTESVSRHAPVPVLVVPPHWAAQPQSPGDAGS